MPIRIGTSGWAYPHWQGRFYPPGMPERDWLAFYAQHFDTVEINRSFYRLPSRENFATWRESTPPGFLFAVKASRFITHMKKLREGERTLPPFLTASSALGEKRGPLLFQLPPAWRADPPRLRDFLAAVPHGLRTAFELRDPSWHAEAVYDILREFNAAFCIYDLGGFTSAKVVTADFTYLRLHGPGAPYCGRYGTRALSGWAGWLSQQTLAEAYVYFDNDEAAHAVHDAMLLRKLLGKQFP